MTLTLALALTPTPTPAQVMGAYESAFRKIKESTGVADVNEVIQKFITQEQTHENLVAMTKDAQAEL